MQNNIFFSILFFLFGTSHVLAQNITFLIDNKVITSTDVTFDVLLSSDTPFKLGSGQVYFNFNTDAFGEWVVTNGQVSINYPTGAVLAEQYAGLFDIYDTFITNDNIARRFSFSWQQGFSSGAIAANNITSTPAVLFQVTIEFAMGGAGEPDNLCFESGSAFDDQTFTACGPTSLAAANCLIHPGTQLTSDNFLCSPALPVELVNFNAIAKEDYTTLLQWQTASELNNEYFIILRSFDGRNFVPIKKVSGAGTSLQAHNYEAIDPQAQPGINYYRLKQTDFDGSYSYSEIRSVSFEQAARVTLSVFPNPAIDQITLSFDQRVKQGKMQLFNSAGQMILAQSMEANTAQFQVQLDQLEAGMYWIKVEADGQIYSRKLIVSRD